MQIGSVSAMTQVWAPRSAGAAAPAVAATPAAEGTKLFTHLTKSDREMLYAATGAHVNDDGVMVSMKEPYTDEDIKAAAVFGMQIDSDREWGRLTGDITASYLKSLMVGEQSGRGGGIGTDVLDRALDFLANRGDAASKVRLPVDVRA